MENIFFASIIGFLLGGLFYYYDRKSGKKLYKKWYDISNKNELESTVNVGFVDGRFFGQRLKIAIAITIVCYIIGFLIIGLSPIHLVFYSGGLLVGIIASFYLSSKLFDMFSKKANSTIDFIESIEKGEQKISDITSKVKESIPSAKEIKEKIIPIPKTDEAPIEDEPKEIEKESPKKDDNWRDGVNKFLDK